MMQSSPRPNNDDATAILRRLEPMLTSVKTELTSVKTEQAKQTEAIQQIRLDIAELRGRVSQLPNLFQIVGPVVALNAAATAFALGLANFLLR
jgi:hypothetical protein